MARQRSHIAGESAPRSQRQLRVGEELRHALARIIERGAIRDPAVAERSVTVTEVQVSPDLRRATVFVVPLGGGDAGPLLDGLRRAAPFLRHEIARQVQLRVMPEFAFEPDTSFDRAERIERLLNSPSVRRDLDGG